MATHCFGRRMSKMRMTVLIYLTSIVVVNVLSIITIPFNSSTTQELVGSDSFRIIMIIIFFETATLISTILLTINPMKNESTIYFIILGTTVFISILDLTFAYIKTINYIVQNKEPEKIYFRNIAVVYVVIKFFVPIGIIRLGMKSNQTIDGMTVFYIRNDDNIEVLTNNSLGSPISFAPPPSYDQCVIDSAPPPPYRDIQK